jgi:hypothetical protein
MTYEEEVQARVLMEKVLRSRYENADYADNTDTCTFEDEFVAKAESGYIDSYEDFIAEVVANTIAELIKKGYINA